MKRGVVGASLVGARVGSDDRDDRDDRSTHQGHPYTMPAMTSLNTMVSTRANTIRPHTMNTLIAPKTTIPGVTQLEACATKTALESHETAPTLITLFGFLVR
jgi:hypothetical protein